VTERAATDRIRLTGLSLFAHVGVSRAERNAGQKLGFELELTGNLESGARADSLRKTIDYERVYRLLVDTVDRSRKKLLEALALEIAEALLEAFPLHEVVVRVRKKNVPFAGEDSTAEVELRRKAAR
jgi:dihydroneopterin aldolase